MTLLMDLIIIGLTYLYIILTIQIPVILKKKDKISKFTARKIVHLFAGLSILVTPFFSWPYWAIVIAGSLTLLTYFSSKESKVKALKELYETIGEEAEENVGLLRRRSYLQGPFHYCLSITILISIFVIFAPEQLYFPIAGILIMIISDTLASIFGKKYGKHKINIPWTGTERTIEGSTMFFLSAFLLGFFSFYVFGFLHPSPTQKQLLFQTVLLYALITCTLATIIELISPSTYDDLTVPICTTLIIWLLALTLFT
ncbi:MAG: diacylglycerol/polyprenol kinase family protein [Promethearchaeota archaeon]